MSGTKPCPNCNCELQTEFKYCPECGQKVDEDLTIKVLFNNTISNYFSVDARFFKSFIPLIFKPGHLPKAFVRGKRLTYLHPAQTYLFISVVFFFMFSFIARDSAASFDKALKTDMGDMKKNIINDSVDSIQIAKIQQSLKQKKDILALEDKDLEIIDSITSNAQNRNESNLATILNFEVIDTLISAGASNPEIKKALGITQEDGWFANKFTDQFIKFYKSRNGGSLLQAFYDSIPIAMFLLLPIFALLLKLFFFKTGRYAHHLVFTFYFFAFLFAVFSIDLILNRFIEELPAWINTLIILSVFVYLFIGIKKFYQKSWVTSFFKTVLVSFFFVFPLVILAVGLIFTAFFTY